MPMENPLNPIVCDGCAQAASPAHIAERLARLERATRFRPVHIHALLVLAAPARRPEDDFYGPPESSEIFTSLMEGLEIPDHAGDSLARLAEFQHRGFYLSYLSECPAPMGSAAQVVVNTALLESLVRRIRFNYKPRRIVLLGTVLSSVIGTLEQSDLGQLLLLDRGAPFQFPEPSTLSPGSGLRYVLRSVLSTGA
jgi:hypothetical protein